MWANPRHQTATRYIGFCPICGGDWKVQDGLLVHHGYRRPGSGYIVGDCPGVHRPPHELSPETAQWYLDSLVQRAANLREAIARAPDRTEFTELVNVRVGWGRSEPKLVTVKKDELSSYEWERKLQSHISGMESELRHVMREIDRVEPLVLNWRPQPLRTVEEDVAQKRAVVEGRKAERQAVRDEKKRQDIERRQARLQSRVQTLQRELDKALRKQDEQHAIGLYAKAVHDLPDIVRQSTFGPADGLRLLDRDEVWRELGLMPGGEYVLPPRGFPYRYQPTSEEEAARLEQQERYRVLVLRRGKYL